MKKFLNKIKNKVTAGYKQYDLAAREKAVDAIEFEVGEMENIFGLLVLGAFVGFPSPPMQITLDLLPVMEKDLITMLNKVDTAESPISDLVSIFDVG